MANERTRLPMFVLAAACILVSNLAVVGRWSAAIMLAGGKEETWRAVALFIYHFPALWVLCMVFLGSLLRHTPIAESAMSVVVMYAALALQRRSRDEVWGDVKWFLILWGISFVLAEGARQVGRMKSRRRPQESSRESLGRASEEPKE